MGKCMATDGLLKQLCDGEWPRGDKIMKGLQAGVAQASTMVNQRFEDERCRYERYHKSRVPEHVSAAKNISGRQSGMTRTSERARQIDLTLQAPDAKLAGHRSVASTHSNADMDKSADRGKVDQLRNRKLLAYRRR